MLTKEEMLEHPNYLLSTYQLEIYRQLSEYMEKNDLINKDVAKHLNVSESYVSQVLNGNFNFTLKKLIQLGLMIKKVPFLEFIEPNEYWKRESDIATKNKAEYEAKKLEGEKGSFEGSYKNISSADLAKLTETDRDGGRSHNSQPLNFVFSA